MTYACHIRPLNIAFYANVCAWIDLMKSQNIIFQNFHQILSDYIFSHLISYNHMLFLYELIQVGIFDLKETLQKFHDLFDDNPDYNTYKHIILFFGPEMYHFSRNIFTYILDKARFEDAHADLTQLKQVEEFAIRGNTNFEYYRIHGETSLLFNEIMYDNISYLKDCQTLTRYSHPHVYFNRFTFIKNFPSLLIAAAYFDAINCFLYLEEICEAQLQSANDNKSRTIYSTQASYVLAAAIAGGSKRIFAYIIQQPNLNSMTLINQRNSCTKLPNPFEVAIQYHRYEMLDILIESVYPDYPTFALAQSSAEFHNIHFFLKYLYSGIEMNQVNFHQTTILMTAALFGLPEMVNLILSFPSCQILQTDDEGKNALYHAVSSKNIAKVKILFKAYCSSNKYNFIHKVHRNAKIEKHLLFQAARVGTSEILDYLLTETGYSPNIRDKFNHTLLHEACFFANIDTIRHLLTLKNIDIHAKTNSKQTAFFKACKKSSLTAIQLLLGANDKSINIRNRKLNLPIHCVAEN
ncbi:hypothetical protein TRFO_22247 [Tritrichomonas foetus]|uniref:Uncharacterized protein n=1 Tax=Tritrichomonas foetus TaxID=1144522 RepID=A0A1J4KI55_9EUKA|nr:hypothetical protein TRFO_22247 [Tritrichomonas foetus]|eukprot:OHT09005.1 hypothetical protein TRFO_22247 [Tritrichomonas foetus]